MIIAASAVSKRYPEGLEALRDVSFAIDAGEMVFITGHWHAPGVEFVPPPLSLSLTVAVALPGDGAVHSTLARFAGS